MRKVKVNWFKLAVHIGALLPIFWTVWNFWRGQLSVNPIQDITLLTGWYALVLLILSLACTPLNTFLGWRWALPLRRLFGLYAFLYAGLHFLIFVGLDYGFDLTLIWLTIVEKRYVLVGFSAFLILLPLAITSTKGWMRRLGRNWKRLHRWVYLASLLVIVHFVWLVKSDIRRPLAYGLVVVLLLLLRLPWVRRMGSRVRSQASGFFRKSAVVDSGLRLRHVLAGMWCNFQSHYPQRFFFGGINRPTGVE